MINKRMYQAQWKYWPTHIPPWRSGFSEEIFPMPGESGQNCEGDTEPGHSIVDIKTPFTISNHYHNASTRTLRGEPLMICVGPRAENSQWVFFSMANWLMMFFPRWMGCKLFFSWFCPSLARIINILAFNPNWGVIKIVALQVLWGLCRPQMTQWPPNTVIIQELLILGKNILNDQSLKSSGVLKYSITP